MKKKYINKIITSLVSLSLIASLLAGCGQEKSSSDNTKKAEVNIETNNILLKTVTENAVGDLEGEDKEETVYVLADSDGSAYKTIVSEHLKVNGKTGSIEDVANLDDIENVKGDETFETGSDGKITWESTGEDIYYKGTTTKEAPVTIKVTYTLDGKEMSAEEMKGKSGDVVIRYDYTNNEEEYTPFVVITGTMLDPEIFSNIEVENGKFVSDGTRDVVVGYALPGFKEGIDLDSLKEEYEDEVSEMTDDEIDINVPEYVEIKAHVENFEMGDSMSIVTAGLFDDIDLEGSNIKDKIDEIKEQMTELSDGSTELVDGTGELNDGAGELNDNMADFTSGTNTLKDGIDDYTDGVEQVKDGADSLKEGGSKLKDGAEDIADGAKKVNSGVGSVKKGAKQLKDGSKTLKDGAKDLNDGAKSLADGADTLESGAKDLKDGIGTLNSGLKDLDDGAGKLKTGISTLDKGIDTLDAGMSVIVSKDEALKKASASVKNGIAAAKQYSDALTSSKEELYNLYLTLNGAGMKEYADKILALCGALYGDGTSENPGLTNVVDSLYSGYNTEETGFDASLNAYIAGVEQVSDGVTTIDDSMEQLVAGSESLSSGLDSAYEGSQKLNKGSKTLYNGTKDLSDGADTLYSGTTDLYDGTKDLYKGAKKLYKGTKTLKSGTSDLYDGSKTFNNGLKQLNSGILALDSGLVKITDNDQSLKSGAKDINDAATKIAEAVNSIHEGTTTLNNGMIKFDEEGIDKITSLFGDNLDEAYNKLEEIIKAGQNYQTFAGKSDTQNASVKFIYKISGTTSEEE